MMKPHVTPALAREAARLRVQRAAPKLLGALQATQGWLKAETPLDVLDKIRGAIAEAEGGAP